MTERSLQYGKVLFSMKLEETLVQQMHNMLKEHKELVAALDNPSFLQKEKHAVIDRLFDEKLRGFLKVITDQQMITQMDDIVDAYHQCVLAEKNWICATFYYVTKPSESQLAKVKEKICQDYRKDGVELKLVHKPSLVGGFVLKVNDFEYDRSVQGNFTHLAQRLIRR